MSAGCRRHAKNHEAQMMYDFNPLEVFSKRATQKLLGLSDRTWDRLESRGDTPVKTHLSPGRVGYRASDLKEWLDQRREVTAA
jgi:predicted DNA-binding transcriptional regulator AlpA